MSDPITRLNAAPEGRYTIERELGEGGMATVCGKRPIRRREADILGPSSETGARRGTGGSRPWGPRR